MNPTRRTLLMAGTLAATLGCFALSRDDVSRLRGEIRIDGSSTVYPITQAVAEEMGNVARDLRITVGVSGTGGGFKRFAAGEIDISDASRPIKKGEHDACVQNGIEYIELPIAYDGLSIVVNKENSWATQLAIDDLRRIYLDGSTVTTWRDLNPAWPDVAIKVYSPGTDSGTFDYFKEVVAGKEGQIRSDMSVSEDDNLLVRGVAGDTGAIGFFGVAYYEENKDLLNVVPIVNPATGEAVAPTSETIENGTYAPFSRPLFIYVNNRSAKRPEVKGFVNFYLANASRLAAEVGYVSLPQVIYDRASANFSSGRTGTQYLDAEGNGVHGPVTEVYR